MPSVLNVGGGATRNLPRLYRGWSQTLLDIDPAVKPDIVCDARKMASLPARQYDAVYCSHALEHFHAHEVKTVLDGFQHVLKETGFVNVEVPDMMALARALAANGHDLGDVWYTSAGGPITFRDVMYGWGRQVASGNEFYCHKTGFCSATLAKALRGSGFRSVYTASDGYNLGAFAFTKKPGAARLASMGI